MGSGVGGSLSPPLSHQAKISLLFIIVSRQAIVVILHLSALLLPYQLMTSHPSLFKMINQTQKYQQLLSALHSPTFQGSHNSAAVFFFKNLQQLDGDLLLNSLQIQEQQRQIRILQEKLGLGKEEEPCQSEANEVLDQQRRLPQESSEDQLPLLFQCSHCGKPFHRQCDLTLHLLLIHSPQKPTLTLHFYSQLQSQHPLT